MKPIMRVSVRNGQETEPEGTPIDAFGLAVIFETLCASSSSEVYVFEGVPFWRADHAFVIDHHGEPFIFRDEIDLEAFHTLLLQQKAS